MNEEIGGLELDAGGLETGRLEIGDWRLGVAHFSHVDLPRTTAYNLLILF